ncbi:hypothetical protein ME5_00034 [Bartonella tamiae Th239]|uniref:Uncharacterized protein n=1 Tax=Bartonella tamiae Th239 TaxID=1094558 RepID=J1K3F1_9HYPH|nr:hypothetical protein ME5_00034 [Bartonella tamiae Th239]
MSISITRGVLQRDLNTSKFRPCLRQWLALNKCSFIKLQVGCDLNTINTAIANLFKFPRGFSLTLTRGRGADCGFVTIFQPLSFFSDIIQHPKQNTSERFKLFNFNVSFIKLLSCHVCNSIKEFLTWATKFMTWATK